jgi:hypothetical protein
VTVKRHGKTVKRFRIKHTGKRALHRAISARKLRRGTYGVTISARAGGVRQTVRLASRRI